MKAAQTLFPLRVELRKTVFNPPREAGDVHVLIYDCGDGETFHTLVHIPSTVRRRFQDDTRAVRLHRLPQNGPAMRALEGHPEYLVTAIALANGEVVSEVPVELVRLRTRFTLLSVAFAIAAVLGAIAVSAWALCILGLSLKAWLRARALPTSLPIEWLVPEDSARALQEALPARTSRPRIPYRWKQ